MTQAYERGDDAQDMSEAYLKIPYVEEVAHLYYNALSISDGTEMHGPSQEELDAWRYPSGAITEGIAHDEGKLGYRAREVERARQDVTFYQVF